MSIKLNLASIVPMSNPPEIVIPDESERSQESVLDAVRKTVAHRVPSMMIEGSTRKQPFTVTNNDLDVESVREVESDEEKEHLGKEIVEKEVTYKEENMSVHLSRFQLKFISNDKVFEDMEESFRDEIATRMKRFVRISTWFILFALLAGIPYDYYRLIADNELQDWSGCGDDDEKVMVSRSDRINRFWTVTGVRSLMLIVVIATVIFTYSQKYQQRPQLLGIAELAGGIGLVIYIVVGRDPNFGLLAVYIVYMYNFIPVEYLVTTAVSVTIMIIFTISMIVRCTSNVMIFAPDFSYLVLFTLSQCISSYHQEYFWRMSYLQQEILRQQQKSLAEEEKVADMLINSMLPRQAVDILKAGMPLKAQKYSSVTVLFCELVDFWEIAANFSTREVLSILNTLYSAFDVLTDQFGVYKVETIGEVYMAVAGCPEKCIDHAVRAAKLATGMINVIPSVERELRAKGFFTRSDLHLRVHIGLNTGPVVAGVVGMKNPRFKLIGDTVNTASRMESTCPPMHVQVSESTYQKLHNFFELELRGTIPVKGKGDLQTYFLRSQKTENTVVPYNSFKDDIEIEEDDGEDTQGSSRSNRLNSASLALDLMMYQSLVHKGRTFTLDLPDFLTNPFQLCSFGLTDPDKHPTTEEETENEEIFGTESSYRKERFSDSVTFLRLSTVGCIMVMLCFGIYFAAFNSKREEIKDEGREGDLFILYLAVLLPIMLVFSAFSTTPQFRVWKYQQFSLLGLTLSLGIGIIASGWIANTKVYGILAIYIVYIYHISILNFGLRLIVGLVLVLAHVILVTVLKDKAELYSDDDSLDPWKDTGYLIVFYIGQAFPVYASELFSRVSFFRKCVMKAQQKELELQKDRSNNLLVNLLPPVIVEEMKHGRKEIADNFENVTILFTDMAGFTAYSSKITPTQLVRFLNRMYSAFDEITNKHGVYKVEVIGDAYFVVGGCPKSDPAHAHRIALTAIDFLKTLPGLREIAGADINIRIGIHTGSVIAGVVGEKDPRYHLFGKSVLTAMRMESHGVPGRIHVSESAYDLLKNDFEFESRGSIEVKDIGDMNTFFLNGPRIDSMLIDMTVKEDMWENE